MATIATKTSVTSSKASVVRIALTGALASSVFFVICWIGAFIPAGPATHMYIELFTDAEVSSGLALLQGVCWSLLFGLIAGTLIAFFYNMLASFDAYGIEPVSTRADAPGAWRHESEKMNYDRVRFEAMRTDKDEVFRFLWENRKKLALREGAYTEILSVRPCVRIGVDGFTLRETVAEYYQVARLTPAELKQKNIHLPPEFVAELKRARAEMQARREQSLRTSGEAAEAQEEPDTDGVTPVYGGGVLIFDEYGKLKYHVHNDVFGSRQTKRLEYLWSVGQLRPGAESARLTPEHLSAIHRQRAIGARRFATERW